MKRKIVTSILSVGLTIASFSCLSDFKSFEAPLENSKWNFSGNPLSCQLSHNVPFYGDAAFAKIAGRDEQMGFSLDYKRQKLAANTVASVRAMAPSWQPMQSSRELGVVKLSPGKHIISTQEKASWRLLNELEIGRFPTFFYQDFGDIQDQVAVALSSVGFQAEYDKFLSCLSSLVPHKLNELEKMTLHFDFDKASIRTSYQTKLKSLAAYLKYDPSIDVVFVSGYTDSKGSRYYNEKLAQRRIESVKQILSLDQVDEARFKTTAFGEQNPVASNRDAAGRAKNRRVFIRIAHK